MNLKNMNKEKMFEIAVAKEYGQELVDRIKLLPDETQLNSMVTKIENKTQIPAILGF
jgi:hypothetical protein